MIKRIDCYSLIEELSKAQTVEDLHRWCSQVCHTFGFDYFLYGARFPISFVKPYLFIISGYPNEWWTHYKDNGYLSVDPVFAKAVEQTTPIHWSEVTDSPLHEGKSRQMMLEAHEFGLKSGISAPVHGPNGEIALLSLASQREGGKIQKSTREAAPFLMLLTTHLHEAARRLLSKDAVPIGKYHLTERERECLLWVAEGKTTWEISQILNISERTVIFHLQNITSKLNVNNRQQAVARAASFGLITPLCH